MLTVSGYRSCSSFAFFCNMLTVLNVYEGSHLQAENAFLTSSSWTLLSPRNCVNHTKMTRRGPAKNEARILLFLFCLVIQAFPGVNVKCNCSFDSYLLSLRVWGRATLVDYCRNERRSDLVDRTPGCFQRCPLYREQATPGERQNLERAAPWAACQERLQQQQLRHYQTAQAVKETAWGEETPSISKYC